MEFGTILGLMLAFGLVFLGIVVDFGTLSINVAKIQFFIDFPSVMIVVGGVFASMLVSYPLTKLIRLGKAIPKVFRPVPEELIETLTLVIDVSKIARKNILAIEDALPSIDNLYLRNGLRLVVDRVDRELIIEILQSEMRYQDIREDENLSMMKTATSLSPAFGMIGTLIGLILMLQNLSDPTSIGPAMAVAIVTTFYGSLLANVVFLPFSNKLSARKGDEKILREMIRDGVLYIEKGERPDFIEQDLMNYLPLELRTLYEEMKFESAKGGG
ncbi:MAG: MotA/TolQ/ExbB proton channel family protein [Candidatus Lambdaproteobacteria bacterium]|nr:MotA/TolQ/ExbB proton channel family protein [Candidatus Lambdaproteobacteria bacterium]